MRIPYKNKQGYADPTACHAITNAVRSEGKIKITEAQEQARLFDWAARSEKKYPGIELMHHVANGGSRHVAEARNLKHQGVKPGVSDIFLPVARHDYHGMYIELKAIGGRVSKPQTDWINKVQEQGYYAVVAYGFDEAQGIIEWYLGG